MNCTVMKFNLEQFKVCSMYRFIGGLGLQMSNRTFWNEENGNDEMMPQLCVCPFESRVPTHIRALRTSTCG